MRGVRVAVLALVTAALPLTARAEILAIPFIGVAFQGQTTPRSPVSNAPPATLAKSLVIGGAGMWLTSGIIGAEAELAHSPSFFERAASLSTVDTVASSRATTISGNLVVAFPRSITRDSLRPYVIGGLGLMRAVVKDVNDAIDINKIDSNLWTLNIGGGAIGYLGEHSGVRFDLRRTRSIRDGQAEGAQQQGIRLSFWRATVGVTFRY
jgi:hypothetical protein